MMIGFGPILTFSRRRSQRSVGEYEVTKISAAGIVEVPAYLVLIEKGYEIVCENDCWTATKGNLKIAGAGPTETLGIANITRTLVIRGEHPKMKSSDLSRGAISVG